MREIQALEIFEIKTLNILNRIRVLDQMFFCGGTMLRLCHNLNRYSTDLDFWIKPDANVKTLFSKIHTALSSEFTIRDATIKRNTSLFEFQSQISNRNLKIEIRKNQSDFHWERKIAFSPFSNLQVAIKGLTLEQMMKNKTAAFLSRKLIRDCFDIEFLLFRGIPLNANNKELTQMLRTVNQFTPKDFKVTLGSLLEPKERALYTENRFQFLKEEILKKIKLDT